MTEHTLSFKHLFSYALFYSLGYLLIIFPLVLFGFVLSGLVSTVAIVIVLNLIVIAIFHKYHRRLLKRSECRFITLSATISTIAIAIVTFVFFFNDIGVTCLDRCSSDFYQIIALFALMAFIFNYLIIFYSLWWMQKLWKKQGIQ